jgi:hypothetical protein
MDLEWLRAFVFVAASMVAMISIIATMLSDRAERRRYARKEKARVEGEFYEIGGEVGSEGPDRSGEANYGDAVGRDREGSGKSNGSRELGSDRIYVSSHARVFPEAYRKLSLKK